MIFFTTLFLSLFITISVIPVMKSWAVKLNVVDIPNERKVHMKPMPKIGGLAMALGAAIPVLFTIEWTQLTRSIMLGAGVIVIFGFIDDLKNLSYKKKFLAQIAAASLVVFQGGVLITSFGMLLPAGVIIPAIIATPLTIIVIVGVTNAINLSDGLDGLAGGISLLTFLCIAFLGYQGDNFEIPFIALAMSGATLGFLRFKLRVEAPSVSRFSLRA